MEWIRHRGLTIVLLAMFAVFVFGQVIAGRLQYNERRLAHQQPELTLMQYLASGHHWEALFENWESEFLQMGVFVVFTTRLYQRGSPESRRIGVTEHVDLDPRLHRDAPGAPWPVRRGGVVLWFYERSLGLAFVALFLVSWVGHLAGGWRLARAEALHHGEALPTLSEYLRSAAFWFESFQNWQSEFLSIAAMVWLSVYLRHRGSPESKAVHAPHAETG
jgi:hypothetical protein